MRCSAELRELLMGLVDPEGPAVDLERLAELLRGDPDARQYYRQFIDLHARLELMHDVPLPMPALEIDAVLQAPGAGAAEEPARPCTVLKSATAKRRTGRWAPPRFIMSAVVGIACAFMIMVPAWLWMPRDDSPTQENFPQSQEAATPLAAPGAIARVTRLADCRWRTNPLRQGTPLTPGRVVDLEAGIAEIKMTGGATVVVEGPARLVIETIGSGYLQEGRISCNVPQDSDGYSVRTPTAMVVDLGTEFGVSVHDDGTTETHVASGMVGLQPRSTDEADESGEVVMVSQSKGARLGPGPRSAATFVAFQSDRFPRPFPSELVLAAHQSGGIIYSHGKGMLLGCNTNTGTRRVGASSLLVPGQESQQTHHGIANVLLFRLPELQDGWQIQAAEFQWTYKSKDGDPKYAVDLYGLGHLNLQAHRGDWFYAGRRDTSRRSEYGLGTDNARVALLARSVIGPDSKFGRVTVANRRLSQFVQSLYDDGAQGGEVAVFRFNADKPAEAIARSTGYTIVHAPVIPGRTTPDELAVLRITVVKRQAEIASREQALFIPLAMSEHVHR